MLSKFDEQGRKFDGEGRNFAMFGFHNEPSMIMDSFVMSETDALFCEGLEYNIDMQWEMPSTPEILGA